PPGNLGRGVQVEHQILRMLWIGRGRSPRMKLQRVELHEFEHGVGIIDIYVVAGAAAFFLERNGADVLQTGGQMLLEEALARDSGRAADNGQRAALDAGKQSW